MRKETFYDKDDCKALDNMTKQEVAGILSEIEGRWMPSRPYLQGEEMEERDFDLLRACKAISLAAEWLREDGENNE